MRQIYSGICLCGHDQFEHHGSMVARPELTDGEHRRAGSCLAYGFNETEGQGPDGELHCDYYVDKDDVERRSTWQGTTREAVLAKYGRTVESEEE